MFKKGLLTFIWPWIQEEVWPILKEYVIDLFIWLITQMVEKFLKWWNAHDKDRQDEARRNEQDATEKASNARTEAERDKYNAVADVWRNVANQYRVENEKLIEQLAKVAKEAKEQAAHDIRKAKTSLTNSSGDMMLQIEDKTAKLPSIKK